jgi:hypothetical protein
MFWKMVSIVIALFVSFSAWGKLSEVVMQVERIDSMRESLVGAVATDKVDPTLFKAVCAPVGQEAQRVAKENQWQFRQASHKARNPSNQAQGIEQKAIGRFQKDKELMSFWLKQDNKNHYFRRITVQEKCLQCHGPKNKRPSFVTEKYKQDKAFDFKQGDLRGLYHITF